MFRNKNKLFVVVSLMLLIMFLFTACSDSGQENGEPAPDDSPRYGGILQLAYGSNPPHFDLHRGDMGQPGSDVGAMMLEMLYDLDSKLMPRPGLAESHKVSDDGLVYDIKLRAGVKFHNGKEMTAEDVVASINRAIVLLPSPPELVSYLDTMEATDKYTVTFRLHKPTGDFLWFLAVNVFCVIPKELCEKYPNTQIPDAEVTGTGPYKMKDRQHDRFVHLVKFNEYSARDEEPDGWSGKKYGYVDEVIFHIIPDQSVRVMGLERGQYHYAQAIDYSDAERVNAHPRMRTIVTMPSAFLRAAANNSFDLTGKVKIRQAVQAAVNCAEILDAAYTFPYLYRLDSSLMVKESKWHTTAGSQHYNQNNPEKAKSLLKEAGYNGEKLIVLGLSETAFGRNSSIVFADQLKKVGFNVDLQLLDTGTFIGRVMQREGWHYYITVEPGEAAAGTPVLLGWTRDVHHTWWEGETPRKKELGRMLREETDFEKRYAIWEELVALSYEEAPRIMFGTVAYCSAAGIDSEGWWDTTFMNPGGPRFWNIWIRK